VSILRFNRKQPLGSGGLAHYGAMSHADTEFGWVRTAGGGAIHAEWLSNTPDNARVYLNGQAGSAERPWNEFQYRFGGAVSSGLLVLDSFCEHMNHMNSSEACEHRIQLRSGSTVVAELVLTRDATLGPIARLVGDGESKYILLSPQSNFQTLHEILLLNLDTGRLTCLLGHTDAVVNVYINRHDAALMGRCHASRWGTGDEASDGTIGAAPAAIDRAVWRFQDPANPSLQSHMEYDGRWVSIGTDPLFIVGDPSAIAMADLINGRSCGVTAIPVVGPAQLNLYTLEDYGRTLCQPSSGTRIGEPSLASTAGPMPALLGVGGKRFMVCAGNDVPRTGFITQPMSVRYTGSATAATVEITSTAMVIRITNGGNTVTSTLDWETYPSLVDFVGDGSGVFLVPGVSHPAIGDAASRFLSPGSTTSRFVPMAPISILNTTVNLDYRDYRPMTMMRSAIESLVTQIRGITGVVPIVCTPTPRGGEGFSQEVRTASAQADVEEYRTWLLEMCDTLQIPVLDLYTLTGTVGQFKSGYSLAGIALDANAVTFEDAPLWAALLDSIKAQSSTVLPNTLVGTVTPRKAQVFTAQAIGSATLGDALARCGTISTPVGARVATDNLGIGSNVEVFRHERRTLSFVLTDASGSPIDVRGISLRFVVHDTQATPTTTHVMEGDDLTVSGDDGNVINVHLTETSTAAARRDLVYRLWNADDQVVLSHGQFTVRQAIYVLEA